MTDTTLAIIHKALQQAYLLGQRYWRHKQNQLADDTDAKFCNLQDNTVAAISATLRPEQPARDGDLVARLKVAARALIRERKCYGEDVETLVDVVYALEAIATQPPQRAEGEAVAWLYRFPHDGETDHALSLTPFLDSWVNSKGATATPLYAQAPQQDDPLADTQREIIEAAERRGYERGLTEEPICPAPISAPTLTKDECIMRGECGCTAAGEEIRGLRSRVEGLTKAARDVCWFDWSDNDDDAVAAVERLRAGLGEEAVREQLRLANIDAANSQAECADASMIRRRSLGRSA